MIIIYIKKSKINHEANNGITPKGVVGDIEFRDIEFKYPAREDVQVLKDLNLKINAGQTVALVGSSGCGKSTCIQLLQRFYDPLKGSISLDGNDFKQLNLKWLRTQIGVVNQEPILFSSSIADNIRMGRDDVTQDEIEFAAKNANAHDFIMTLPNVLLYKFMLINKFLIILLNLFADIQHIGWKSRFST